MTLRTSGASFSLLESPDKKSAKSRIKPNSVQNHTLNKIFWTEPFRVVVLARHLADFLSRGIPVAGRFFASFLVGARNEELYLGAFLKKPKLMV
jgi:hypothetical protein